MIETSGLADPMPIAYTVLAEPVLQHHFRLGNVVTTLDACNALYQLDHFPEATQQVAAADRIVLTKVDIADEADTGMLRERLARLNAAAPILEPGTQGIDALALLAEDAHGSVQGRAHEAERWIARAGTAAASLAHEHTQDVTSFCVQVDRALDWTAFGVWMTMLLNRYGDRVLRIKGLLRVAGIDGPVLINAAQHIVHPPSHLESWPGDGRSTDAATRIVFIVHGLDGERIRASLEAFNALSNRSPGDSRTGVGRAPPLSGALSPAKGTGTKEPAEGQLAANAGRAVAHP